MHAFLARVRHLAGGAGHVGLVAAVGAGDLRRAEADRRAHAIHAGVAAAEYHHALAAQVGQRERGFPAGDGPAIGRVAADDAAVLHQERQRRQHPRQVLAGQPAIGVAIRAEPEEHRVVVLQQGFDGDVTADLDPQPERHAHAFQDRAAGGDDGLVQLEAGDAELQQAADLLIAVEHGGLHAGAREAIGASEAGRPGADHRDPLAGRHHLRQVGPPALRERGVDDVFLDRADGHRAELVVQRAGAFAEPVLRADAAAHLRQRVGLVAERGGLQQAAFLDQLQPVRDVVVDRALRFAVRVAAVQATPGLVAGLGRAEAAVELVPVAADAFRQRHLRRHLARRIAELEDLLATHAARLRSLASASRLAAFGFTSQNLPM